MKCVQCQTVSSVEAMFCYACGSPLAGEEIVECDNHTGTKAAGVCVVCGKPVCVDCSVLRERRVYCDDASHAELSLSHVKLGAAGSEFEADFLAHNLSANGISVVVFYGLRYSQLCRLTDNVFASLFVKNEMLESARRLLGEMDLADFFLDQTPSL